MNVIIYFMVFLLAGWDCIQQFIIQMDGAGRFPFWCGLGSLFFLVATDPKKLKMQLSHPVIWIWLGGLWAIFNTMRIGIQHILCASDEIFYYRVMIPVLLFVFVYIGGKINLKKCLIVLMCSMYMACLIYLHKASMNTWGSGENETLRLSSETLNANFLAFYALASFFVVLFYASKYRMSKLLLISAGVVSGYMIFSSQSRTGYTCFLIFLFCFFASKVKFSIRKLLFATVLLSMLFYANKWVMENTGIGNRFEMREYETEHAKGTTGTALDAIFGERAVYFSLCAELFPKHPYCGVGEYNFIYVNPLSKNVCHNEYIRILTEEGLIGVLPFALFFITLCWTLISKFRKYPECRQMLFMCGGGIIGVMTVYMGSFAMPMMQIILAVCAAEVFSDSPKVKHQAQSEYAGNAPALSSGNDDWGQRK